MTTSELFSDAITYLFLGIFISYFLGMSVQIVGKILKNHIIRGIGLLILCINILSGISVFLLILYDAIFLN